MFRQKLWPQSHFGPGRRYPISPLVLVYSEACLVQVQQRGESDRPQEAAQRPFQEQRPAGGGGGNGQQRRPGGGGQGWR